MPTYKLDVKVFLQGALSSGVMTTLLNSKSLLPLSNPYNYSGNPWGYSGTESVTSIPNSSVTDWILVELRSTPTGSVIDSRAGFILKTGSIVDTDGSSTLEFPSQVSTDSFYVVVYHRNHISIMSSSSMDGSASSYDFTTSQSQAYGLNAMKQIGSVYSLYAGDIDANGVVEVTGNDYTIWVATSPKLNVYNIADCNLDSRVNTIDYNNFLVPNNGMTTQVP